ncbi:hypothetical protein HP439_11435 [Sphingobacterium shayense]|uniref:hypothetical protein n=1 Tax=Sphingobacterium shayense TaxID=626343 RepID=UPI0015525FA6|nr:hypothetical protein [Sphingobacterium shayense]NQD71333.1 hypothetical protein [Sphingobacterium shayense]
MGLLRKLSKKQPQPIKLKKITDLYVHIDEMKQKGLLETTNYGIFYIFVELVKVNKNPDGFLKQLYIYARTTNLLRVGQKLEIRDLEVANDDFLIAEILGDKVTLHQTTRTKKVED